MNERQRAILQEVADGKIAPEEAVRLLDEAEEPHGGEPDGPEEQPSVETAGIQRVRLVGAFRPARVIGDPDVAEAVVEGPHLAEREGDVLVVHGDEVPGVGVHGFAFSRGDRPWYASRPGRPRRPRRHEPSGHWHHGQWEAHWGPGPWGPPGAPHAGPGGGPPGWAGRWALLDAFRRFGDELTVRMRPDLALDASVTAGSLKVAGVTGPLRVAVAGGSAKIDRFGGPLDLSVEAGSVKGSGLLVAGSSHIHCQAGSVRIHLERGSSVKVRASAELGNVVLPGDPDGEHWLAGGGAREVAVGDGAGLLEIEAHMGNVVVSAER